MTLVVFGVALGVVLVVLVGIAAMLKLSLVHTRASEALVVYAPGREPRVSFRGGLVLPFQAHEIVDVSAKELVLERRGRSSLRCRDSLRADVVLSVSVAVNPTSEDVIHAARALGIFDLMSPADRKSGYAGAVFRALRICFLGLKAMLKGSDLKAEFICQ